MSMIGNYRRVSEKKLQELLAHSDRLLDFLYPDAEENPDACLDIDKTWHIIHFLLTGETWEGEWPLVAVVMGGTEISDQDVGYGPARYLTPGEVGEVSAALHAVSADTLLSRFDVQAVRQADIYPDFLSESPEDQAYIREYYTQLQAFFLKAAEAGEVMVVYLS